MRFDGILVTRRHAAWLHALMRPGLDAHRRGTYALPDDIAQLVDELRAMAEEHVACVKESGKASGRTAAPSSEVMEAMSTKDAAKALGVTPQAVTLALRAGRLDGQRVGRTWIVDGASVMEALENRKQRGVA